jgi:ABC-type multidrug transport system ATPase subunit
VTTAIETFGLTKTYGELTALEPLDLSIDEGDLVMLVGPNGSGKTTLLRMVAGLLEASAGEVLVDGHAAGSLDARAALSYIPDNPVLYDDLTLAEHLHFVARLHGVSGEEAGSRSEGLLAHLGLLHRSDDLPATFSRGLKQKTSIALGLIRPFSVLCVDEPFVGLDQPGKVALLDLVHQAHDQGATVVIATHSLEFATIARRCIALRDGELSYDGEPSVETIEKLVS